ncbi:MAG: hypothetical protein RL065_1680 [Bacteroidota bacterium]
MHYLYEMNYTFMLGYALVVGRQIPTAIRQSTLVIPIPTTK